MAKWLALTDVSVYPKLVELAGRPFDLRPREALNEDRMRRYCCSASGIDLLYATQRVNDEVLACLQDLADQGQLVEQFRLMRRGAIINRIEGFPSEERQVLHTASRDLFGQHPAEPIATELAGRELAKLKSFLEDLETGRLTNALGQPFDTMIQVGLARAPFMRPYVPLGSREGRSISSPTSILMMRPQCSAG